MGAWNVLRYQGTNEEACPFFIWFYRLSFTLPTYPLCLSFPLSFDAKARSALDKYKTVLLVTFETPSIDFQPNADYNTTIVGRHMGQDTPNISQL
jgi:hypothetical protein